MHADRFIRGFRNFQRQSSDRGTDMRREDQIKSEIREGLRKLGGILAGHRVVLFGSRAAGTAKERSDFDIGILGEKPLSVEKFFKLQELMDAVNTLHSIDLVDLTTVSDGFRNEALKHTEVLYG